MCVTPTLRLRHDSAKACKLRSLKRRSDGCELCATTKAAMRSCDRSTHSILVPSRSP